jgi:hypothetical protein
MTGPASVTTLGRIPLLTLQLPSARDPRPANGVRGTAQVGQGNSIEARCSLMPANRRRLWFFGVNDYLNGCSGPAAPPAALSALGGLGQDGRGASAEA